MREVGIVEEEDETSKTPRAAATDPGASTGGDRLPGRPWVRRLRRWWPVAVGLVLVLVAGQLVLDARQRAALQRVTELPGALRPLAPPLAVLPYAGALPMAAIVSGVDVAGLRVLARPDSSGQPRDVVAYDPGSGAEVWRSSLASGATGPVVPDCAPTADEMLICVGRPVGDSGDVPAAGGTSRLVALRATDGTQVWSQDVPVRTQLAAAGDLAAIAYRAPGAAAAAGAGDRGTPTVVARLDLTTGEQLWTQRLEALDADEALTGSWVSLWADGAHLGVRTEGGAWLLDGAGREVASTADGDFQPTRTGDVFVTDLVQLVGLGGRPALDVVGSPVNIVVDDGSASQMLFLAGSGVRAVDSSTRRVVWSAPDAGTVSSAVVLDGVLYVLGTRGLRAWDARTGDELWWAKVVPDSDTSYVLSTDGRDLYMVRDERGAVSLTTFGRTDGQLHWSWPLPAGADALTVLDGRLWVHPLDNGVTAYRLVG